MQKWRDGIAVNVDHLEIGQAVYAAHAQSHDAEDERQAGQRRAQRDEDHADRYDNGAHQQDVIGVHSESICTFKRNTVTFNGLYLRDGK